MLHTGVSSERVFNQRADAIAVNTQGSQREPCVFDYD